MGGERRRILLMALLSLWALMWGYSFVVAFGAPPAGTGGPGSPDRGTLFVGWQLGAALPAFASWVIGRHWPKGSGVRFVSRVPLQLATGLGAVILGLILLARVAA